MGPQLNRTSSDISKQANKEDVESIGTRSEISTNFKATYYDQVKRWNESFHYVRYAIIILGGFLVGHMFLCRLSITVAIISMVNHTALFEMEHPNYTQQDLDEAFPVDYVETGEFHWTNEIQQTILSGYMIAYTIPQFYTTRLTLKYGLQKSLCISILICALSCLLVPIMSYWSWMWLLALRLLNGLGASAILPTMIGAVEKWMPYHQSAKGLSLLQFVQGILYSMAPMIGGYLTWLNWKWAFFVPGISCIIIGTIWYLVSTDDPEQCKFISQKELDHIKGRSDSTNVSDLNSKVKKKAANINLPWYFMFKIPSFYGLCIIWMLYCSTSGGFFFLIPVYFNRVLRLSINDNGLYIFLINSGGMFSMIWPNPVTEWLQRRFNFSLTGARIIVQMICLIGTAGTFICMAAVHEYQIFVMCINRFFLNTNDTLITATLMSQYGKAGLSSVSYSMMNTFGNLSTVFFCWAAGRYLDYTGESLECWSWIFLTMATFVVAIFAIYATCESSEPIEFETKSEKDLESKL